MFTLRQSMVIININNKIQVTFANSLQRIAQVVRMLIILLMENLMVLVLQMLLNAFKELLEY